MTSPNHRVVGIALVAAGLALGWVLLNRGEPESGGSAAEPPARSEILRELRSGATLAGPERAPFRLRYTDEWAPLDRATLAAQEQRPVAGLRRRDNTGALTVSVGGPIEGGLPRLRRTLPATLDRRFADFRLITIRQVRVEAGRALYTSFVRERSREIQTMLVVPDGDHRSYQVDAVIRGADQATAAQVGVMLGTFDVAGR